jgi:hypothetical protein
MELGGGLLEPAVLRHQHPSGSNPVLIFDVTGMLLSVLRSRAYQRPSSLSGTYRYPPAAQRYPGLVEELLALVDARLDSLKQEGRAVVVAGGAPPPLLLPHYRRLVYVSSLLRRELDLHNFVNDALAGSALHDELALRLRETCRARGLEVEDAPWKSPALFVNNFGRYTVEVHGFCDEYVLLGLLHCCAATFVEYRQDKNDENDKKEKSNENDKKSLTVQAYALRRSVSEVLADKDLEARTRAAMACIMNGVGHYVPPPLVPGSSDDWARSVVMPDVVDAGKGSEKDITSCFQSTNNREQRNNTEIQSLVAARGAPCAMDRIGNRPDATGDPDSYARWVHAYNQFMMEAYPQARENRRSLVMGYLEAVREATARLVSTAPRPSSSYCYYEPGYPPLTADVEREWAASSPSYKARFLEPTGNDEKGAMMHHDLENGDGVCLAALAHPDLLLCHENVNKDNNVQNEDLGVIRFLVRNIKGGCLDLYPSTCTYVSSFRQNSAWDIVPVLPPMDLSRVRLGLIKYKVPNDGL